GGWRFRGTSGERGGRAVGCVRGVSVCSVAPGGHTDPALVRTERIAHRCAVHAKLRGSDRARRRPPVQLPSRRPERPRGRLTRISSRGPIRREVTGKGPPAWLYPVFGADVSPGTLPVRSVT